MQQCCSVHCPGRVGKWAIIDTASDDPANSGTGSGALCALAIQSVNVVNRAVHAVFRMDFKYSAMETHCKRW